MQKQLRVGKIRYLNCLPFYFGLEEKLKAKDLAANFLEAHPADLNRALQNGAIDLGPVSSLEYLAHQDDYLLLPELAIGAGNFARSVILFSKEKLKDLDGATIALSEESASSAALLRILLKCRYDFENQFETVAQDPARVLRKYPAALMIGDAALFSSPRTGSTNMTWAKCGATGPERRSFSRFGPSGKRSRASGRKSSRPFGKC